MEIHRLPLMSGPTSLKTDQLNIQYLKFLTLHLIHTYEFHLFIKNGRLTRNQQRETLHNYLLFQRELKYKLHQMKQCHQHWIAYQVITFHLWFLVIYFLQREMAT